MSHVQNAVMCDENASSSMTPFMIFQGTEKEKGRYVLKDEKKHHSAVDESSSEQQFCKSDAITFIV